MNINRLRSRIKAFAAVKFFTVTMLLSGFAFSATHNIVMTAEYVANGQPAYKMISHTSSEGATPDYPVEAVIPGPTLFVKEGDVINIELTNNTQTRVGFLVPALSGLSG
ncbi:MAG: copper oxidase, partial [Nitrosomonas sp.]|nr:copper oxidase [Nitrosomonas sp.]